MTKQNSIFKLLKSVEFLYIVGCLSALVIPWFVSVSPSISDSYYYGFSNKAGLYILLPTIAMCLLLLYKKGNNWLIKYFDANAYYSNISNNEFKLKFKAFYILCVLIFILFLYVLNRTGWAISYGESAYFIKRLYLMQDGLKPYIDFEFAYGSLLLYFPFFLVKLLPISIPVAYEISLFVEAFIGFYSLWYVTSKVTHSKFNNRIFFLLFLPAYVCIFMGGVNYTLFRFVTPIFLIIWASAKIYIRPNILNTLVYLALVFFATIIISPEIAITSTLALFCFIILSHSFSFKSILTCMISIVILGAISMSIKFIDQSFITLYIFSQGGNNFPWFMAPTMLAFLLFIYVSLVVVVGDKKKNLNKSQIIIFISSILNLPGALGRCDSGHLFFYGFGFFLIALSAVPYILSSKLRTFISMTYKIIFFVFVIIGTIYLYRGYWGGYIQYIFNKNIANTIVTKQNNSQIDSLILYANSKPLVLTTTPVFFENNILRHKLDFPYFIDGMNKLSIYSNEVLIKEILSHDVIIAPQNRTRFCGGYLSLSKSVSFFLFGIPIFYKKENNPDFINQKICLAIDNNFIIDTSIHAKNFTVYKKVLTLCP